MPAELQRHRWLLLLLVSIQTQPFGCWLFRAQLLMYCLCRHACDANSATESKTRFTSARQMLCFGEVQAAKHVLKHTCCASLPRFFLNRLSWLGLKADL
jgi:hypothetical protein